MNIHVKHCISFCLLILICVCFTSCAYGLHEVFGRKDSVYYRSASIVKLPTPLDKKSLTSFFLITDIHYGAKTVDKETLVDKLTEYCNEHEKPSFCVVLGDMTETGKEFDQYEALQTSIEELGIPVYGIVGNHDLYNNGWTAWKEVCNPHHSYYKFETKNISYYFLDTGSGTLGSSQLNDVKKNMTKDTKPKLVFTHYPIYSGGILYFCLANTTERAELFNLFANTNVKYIFSGHYHTGKSFDYGQFKELTATSLKQKIFYVVHLDENNKEEPVREIEKISW